MKPYKGTDGGCQKQYLTRQVPPTSDWDTVYPIILCINVSIHDLGPLLLIWVKSNRSMDKNSQAQWNNLSIPKLQQHHHWSLGMDK